MGAHVVQIIAAFEREPRGRPVLAVGLQPRVLVVAKGRDSAVVCRESEFAERESEFAEREREAEREKERPAGGSRPSPGVTMHGQWYLGTTDGEK